MQAEGGEKEEPHDEEAQPAADAAGAKDEKKDAAMESPAKEKGGSDQEKAKEPAPFAMQDSMKGRLLRFTLEEGELENIPTGRSLRDSFPEDSGVVFVDQV